MVFDKKDIREINLVAEAIAALLKDSPGLKFILLQGELGAGKTTLIKAVVKAFGGEDLVASPTFPIHNTYSTPAGDILHSDLYRLESEVELEATGFYELTDTAALCFIEWGDKFSLKDMLERYMEIRIIKQGDTLRQYTVILTPRQGKK